MKERAIDSPTAIAPPGGHPHAGGPHIEIARRPKRVAILQSNYIPWKGYFDVINMVDEFILFDDMQYTRRDWRNRNKIKTKDGLQWLTIPVEVKGKYHQRIRDTVVSDTNWNVTHWRTIAHSYVRAPGFAEFREPLEELYRTTRERFLSLINYRFLTVLCALLSIPTRITWSSDYLITSGKTDRLVDLCKQAGAGEYLTGPAAGAYLDESLFAREGIRLIYMDYSKYLEYPQLYPPFEHGVSIVDLLLNVGREARRYLKSA
jgi:hypothetical protein